MRKFGLLLMGLMLAPGARGEVSVVTDGAGSFRGILHMYDTTAPEATRWKVFRTVPARLALNGDGDLFGDGPPDITLNPVTGLPEVVWSLADGSDTEIAFARFDGIQWTGLALFSSSSPLLSELPREEIQRVTQNEQDDLDPRLDVGTDGFRRLTWWRISPSPHVLYTEAVSGATVFPDAAVLSDSDVESSYPDIGSREGEVFVAVESIEAGTKLVVVIQGLSSDFTYFLEDQRDTEPFAKIRIAVSLAVAPAGLDLQMIRAIPILEWIESPSLRARSRYRPPDRIWEEPVLEEVSE
ncbi:MAG: hypothetical protein HY509_02655 [Acidobacteria bacterium]|nr:hypothetical protein [Acidobacteriota bacterium]